MCILSVYFLLITFTKVFLDTKFIDTHLVVIMHNCIVNQSVIPDQ